MREYAMRCGARYTHVSLLSLTIKVRQQPDLLRLVSDHKVQQLRSLQLLVVYAEILPIGEHLPHPLCDAGVHRRRMAVPGVCLR